MERNTEISKGIPIIKIAENQNKYFIIFESPKKIKTIPLMWVVSSACKHTTLPSVDRSFAPIVPSGQTVFESGIGLEMS